MSAKPYRFRIGRHVHPKAHADTPPAAAPTGIDYLRLVADRHTQALGEQLQYARLSDPTGPAGPSSLPAPQRPPAENGLPYDTDLLALATTEHAGAERDDPPPMSGPDPALEAELDSFAALLKPHSTRASPAAATDPKEHQ